MTDLPETLRDSAVSLLLKVVKDENLDMRERMRACELLLKLASAAEDVPEQESLTLRVVYGDGDGDGDGDGGEGAT